MEGSLAILLAAGMGERMKSRKHKVLHPVQGQPIIDYVVRAVREAGIDSTCAVVGALAEQVREHLGGDVRYALQEKANGWGTAKAAQAAMEYVGAGPVFVILGDSPLIRPETLKEMLRKFESGADAVVMTARVDDPTGYGRILRDGKGAICSIVEQRDATEEQLRITEVNSAALCCDGKAFRELVPLIDNDNQKGEYYLTDLIGLLYARGKRIEAVCAHESEGVGINDRAQLAQAGRLMRNRINEGHMRAGVTLLDPERTDIGPDVAVGSDTVVYPGCVLTGRTIIGEGCVLLPNCRVEDARVADGVTIENSVLLDCEVGAGSTVGPFAYLRPGTKVGERCRIGDFVEVKNSVIGDETKVSHLTYIGDGDLGKDINIGCGVVFTNYDGKKKYRSCVGDHAFIGCNVNLVSPVNVGERAYIAAGTTVTEDVPPYALAIGRAQPAFKEGWVTKRIEDGKLK